MGGGSMLRACLAFGACFAEADGSSASLSELWPYAAAQFRNRTEASRHAGQHGFSSHAGTAEARELRQ